MRLDHIRQVGGHRRDLGDITELAESIAAVGLLHPLVITPDGKLVAGRRRLAALRTLGWESAPAHVVENFTEAADLLRAEADENACRKDLTPTEARAIRKAREALLKPAAEERQGTPTDLEEPLPNFGRGSQPRTSKLAAVGTGYSDETLRKVDKVAAVAEDPETPEPVKAQAEAALAEMDATGKVDGPYRAVMAAAMKAAIKADPATARAAEEALTERVIDRLPTNLKSARPGAWADADAYDENGQLVLGHLGAQHHGQVRVAYLLAEQYAGRLLHVHGLGWHTWTGSRWVLDQEGHAKRAVLDVLRTALASSLDDKELRRDVAKCESASSIAGVLDIASALEPFATTVADLDADPFLLNVANGTLDCAT